ncbi:DUF763 domain-containing protein [Porticoccaceae bacterium]|jgi:hypothetical protein|nr:DUF763 domain-containing protein [Porticoccaceae bacterium]
MRVNTHVTLVVDNTAPQTQRSKCATPPQSFLTDQHPIYGDTAEVVRTQQSGGYWHFTARLASVLDLAYNREIETFDDLVDMHGVGPRTLKALEMANEVIHGDAKTFSENLIRFYGQKLGSNSNKEKHIGNGVFDIFLFRDNHPKYGSRETSRGHERPATVTK